MKVEYRKLSIALILLYAACMIFTTYTLFRLQSDLVYKSQVISISELSTAAPVFTKLFIVAGVTLLVGLGAMLISLSKRNEEVIYVEKKEGTKKDKKTDSGETSRSHTLNLDTIRDMIAKENDEALLAKNILNYLCTHMESGIGAFYTTTTEDGKRFVELKSSYALALGESQTLKFEFGEGLVGQAALEEKTLIIDDIPEGYIKIVSGLGSATPTHLLVVPVKQGDELYGVVEIASFTPLGKKEGEMTEAAFKLLTQKSTKGAEKKEAPAKEENDPEAATEPKPEKKSRSAKKGNNKA